MQQSFIETPDSIETTDGTHARRSGAAHHTIRFFRGSEQPKLLEKIYRFRYRRFVEQLGWALDVQDGREIDEFDHARTHYCVCLMGDEVVGCWRALPTTEPYLLETLAVAHPELIGENALPKRASIWEISRFTVDPAIIADVAPHLLAAMFRFARRLHVHSLLAVTDPTFERFLRRAGIHTRRFAPPAHIGRDSERRMLAVAGEIPVPEQHLPNFTRIKSLIADQETSAMTTPDLIAFAQDPLGFVMKRGQAEGPFVELDFGAPVYLLTQPEHVRDILAVPERIVRKGEFVERLRVVVGDSLLTGTGAFARERRQLAHKHFRQENLKAHAEEFAAIVRNELALLSYGHAPVNLPELTGRLALRIILTLLLGHDILDREEETRLLDIVSRFETVLAESIWAVSSFDADAVRDRIADDLDYLDALVVAALARAKGSSLVCDYKEAGLDSLSIRNEVVTLLLAGYLTSGSVAAWMLYHLAQDKRLAAAIAAETEAASDEFGEVPFERWAKMTHSQAAMREALRLYPGAWWFSRDLAQDVEIAGKTLPQGSIVVIAPYLFHRDARWWDEPNAWNPYRAASSNPAAYIPFGRGARACIGNTLAMFELQIIASSFATAFEMDAVEIPDVTQIPSITLRADPRLAINVRARGNVDALSPALFSLTR